MPVHCRLNGTDSSNIILVQTIQTTHSRPIKNNTANIHCHVTEMYCRLCIDESPIRLYYRKDGGSLRQTNKFIRQCTAGRGNKYGARQFSALSPTRAAAAATVAAADALYQLHRIHRSCLHSVVLFIEHFTASS